MTQDTTDPLDLAIAAINDAVERKEVHRTSLAIWNGQLSENWSMQLRQYCDSIAAKLAALRVRIDVKPIYDVRSRRSSVTLELISTIYSPPSALIFTSSNREYPDLVFNVSNDGYIEVHTSSNLPEFPRRYRADDTESATVVAFVVAEFIKQALLHKIEQEPL